MKIKEIKYTPIIDNYVDGIPTYWLMKEEIYFGISWCYSLIGQEGKDSVPFQTLENLNQYRKLCQN